MLTSALFCNCRYQHSFVAADFCTEKSAVRIRTSAKFGTCKTAKKLRTWLILSGKHWSFGPKGLSLSENIICYSKKHLCCYLQNRVPSMSRKVRLHMRIIMVAFSFFHVPLFCQR